MKPTNEIRALISSLVYDYCDEIISLNDVIVPIITEIEEGQLKGRQEALEEVKKIIDDYFRYLDNADYIICGCGCNTKLTAVHGVFNRVEIGLKQKIKELEE